MTDHLLETERLRLRLIELADAPLVQKLVSDRQIAENTLNIPYPYPEDGAAIWIQGMLQQRAQGGQDRTYVILRRADDELVGCVGIHPRHGFRAEIGYWVGVPYWGQGYMTEAVRRLIRSGFEDMQLQRIEANHFLHNPASGRVMQKAGMTFEGIMRQHLLKWGRFVDLAWYSILRSEFETQRK